MEQKGKYTIISKEYTNDNSDEPYYPVPNERNMNLYEQYKKIQCLDNVLFAGRLANYKYYIMDQAIENELSIYKNINLQ